MAAELPKGDKIMATDIFSRLRGQFRHPKIMTGKISRLTQNLWNQEEGATAIEYGLIAGLVAIIIITGLTLLGTDLSNMFNTVANTI